MTRTSSRYAVLTALITLLLALPAHASVNKSITIDAGATSNGASTVNGKVTIGAGATVTGTDRNLAVYRGRPVRGRSGIDRDALVNACVDRQRQQQRNQRRQDGIPA